MSKEKKKLLKIKNNKQLRDSTSRFCSEIIFGTMGKWCTGNACFQNLYNYHDYDTSNLTEYGTTFGHTVSPGCNAKSGLISCASCMVMQLTLKDTLKIIDAETSILKKQ